MKQISVDVYVDQVLWQSRKVFPCSEEQVGDKPCSTVQQGERQRSASF